MKNGQNLKVGDFCICQFELAQINHINKHGRITEIQTEIGREIEYDFRPYIFELNFDVIRISTFVKYWFDKLKEIENINVSRFEPLSNYILDSWVEMCQNKDNKTQLKELSKNFKYFCNLKINDYI